MNKAIFTSLCLFLVFLLSLFFIPFEQNGEAKSPNERVVVLFKQKVDKTVIENVKGKVNREYKNIPALAVSVPSTALKGLAQNPNVARIENDFIFQVKTQTQDWGITQTNAQAAWSSSLTGSGVKVAIVDTGIATHDDLVISGGASFVSYTHSYQDDNGHGTHVAGIIGAKNNSIGTVGIAPASNLYAVKVLDSTGTGYLSDVLAGIDWAITNKMDIINISLGTNSDSLTLKSLVDQAYQNNILVVAAAGNDGTSDGSGDTVDFPARYDSVIAVGATDNHNQRGFFSSTGEAVFVAAPGVNILSTYKGNTYAQMSGTSMAAPFTSGTLALLKQQNPSFTAAQLSALLQKNTLDLGMAGKDTWFGYGLIQAPGQSATTTQPIVVPKKTVTTVTTNKTSYLLNEKIMVRLKVTDKSSLALSKVSVVLTVANPNGQATKVTLRTDSTGYAYYTYPTSKRSVKGSYKLTAQSTLSGYTGSTATTTFGLR